MNKGKIIANTVVVILIIVLIINGILSRFKERDLKSNHKIALAKVNDTYWGYKTVGTHVEYKFIVSNIEYKSSRVIDQPISIGKAFQNRNIPVAYEPANPENNYPSVPARLTQCILWVL